jgi:SAM-dependent methyltransferase
MDCGQALDSSGERKHVDQQTRTEKRDSAIFIFFELLWRICEIALSLIIVLSVAFFPRSSDSPLTTEEQSKLQAYYATAYNKRTPAEEKEDTRYVQIAQAAAEAFDVVGHVTRFASDYGLADKKVLDIGAGRGYLQDVVKDYTALDISPSVRRFFHKPFVLASATLMPFPNSSFYAAWSIWVFEHVPNPEAGLSEARRVIQDGGLLFLMPAWDCKPWAADGYPVRPYRDFDLGGKLIKATVVPRQILAVMAKPSIRFIRYATWKVSATPTRLHYSRLTPNYDYYWMPDTDAVNSLDRYETAMWFLSRGDECLNCDGPLHGLVQADNFLIIRIHKR